MCNVFLRLSRLVTVHFAKLHRSNDEINSCTTQGINCFTCPGFIPTICPRLTGLVGTFVAGTKLIESDKSKSVISTDIQNKGSGCFGLITSTAEHLEPILKIPVVCVNKWLFPVIAVMIAG
ncbi:hypothetical protein SDC9_123459 [bioreactor metagenome]|uniref:Uncharacterized protein n=1 Tax=bioreactor metagenome TaxID=1076179 RepID=A0A645CHQ4_9ZZZZ